MTGEVVIQSCLEHHKTPYLKKVMGNSQGVELMVYFVGRKTASLSP
jgi:hypothetical protein